MYGLSWWRLAPLLLVMLAGCQTVAEEGQRGAQSAGSAVRRYLDWRQGVPLEQGHHEWVVPTGRVTADQDGTATTVRFFNEAGTQFHVEWVNGAFINNELRPRLVAMLRATENPRMLQIAELEPRRHDPWRSR